MCFCANSIVAQITKAKTIKITSPRKFMNIELPVTCPFCASETNIFIEVDSPSDYYFDSSCESCEREILKIIQNGRLERIEDIVYDTVMDNYAARADYLVDNR